MVQYIHHLSLIVWYYMILLQLHRVLVVVLDLVVRQIVRDGFLALEEYMKV